MRFQCCLKLYRGKSISLWHLEFLLCKWFSECSHFQWLMITSMVIVAQPATRDTSRQGALKSSIAVTQCPHLPTDSRDSNLGQLVLWKTIKVSCSEISYDQKRMSCHSFSYIAGLLCWAGHESCKTEPLLGAKPVPSSLKGCSGNHIQVHTKDLLHFSSTTKETESSFNVQWISCHSRVLDLK